ncbi:hypothetical protein BDZ45DRAFT_727340 [Acephala macrosclerotiorum]|nr:hypothetical protein BDZ45DRAFT_727340 [Acephala macrosclerotiorum]
MAAPHGAVDLAVAIPTLVGSLLSSIGTCFILLTYIFLPPKLNHVRHTLIRNLAVSEFGLHLGGSISGLTIIALGRDLQDGPGCVASGFLTQLCVQAVDCNMLVISITLFFIITQRFDLVKPPRRITAALIIAPWILPTITSFTALAKHFYHPVSGNWCWIQAEPKYLRYVFTHGWRFMFIIAILAIGLRIRLYVKKNRIKPQDGVELEGMYSEGKDQATSSFTEHLLETQDHDDTVTVSEKRKTLLLLSGYPLFYVVLWLPGIANRVAEATGHPVRVLAILQASTTYIGFANAVTFGWNEVREQFSVHRMLELTLGFMLSD